MTPLYLNPFPLVELKEDDHQHVHLFIPVPDQSGSILKDPHHVDKVEKRIWHSGSSDGDIVSSSSSSSLNPAGESGHKLCLRKRSEDGNDNNPAKWMSSKMRLMQRMMSSNCALTEKPESFAQTFPNDKEINFATNGNNSSIRVCSDCNTTSTPLWRSGPLGPKSLCNACGIRQRKARRAMAEAANGVDITATQTSSMKAKVHNKEKKSRTSNLGQYKKQYCKPVDAPSESRKKLCFKDFALSLSKNSAFQRVFPQDEEEAAILLMQLSCHGLVHS